MTWTVDIAMPKARELDRRCEHRENSQHRSGDKSGDLCALEQARGPTREGLGLRLLGTYAERTISTTLFTG